jgi:hypothetical protein
VGIDESILVVLSFLVDTEILAAVAVGLVGTCLDLPYFLAVTDDGYISVIRDVEEDALQCYVGVCYGLELLRVPEGVLLSLVLEVLADFDVVIEVIESMFEPILEDGGVPVVRPSLVTIYHVDQDFQLRFIGIVLQDFNYLSLGDVLVLYG